VPSSWHKRASFATSTPADEEFGGRTKPAKQARRQSTYLVRRSQIEQTDKANWRWISADFLGIGRTVAQLRYRAPGCRHVPAEKALPGLVSQARSRGGCARESRGQQMGRTDRHEEFPTAWVFNGTVATNRTGMIASNSSKNITYRTQAWCRIAYFFLTR